MAVFKMVLLMSGWIYLVFVQLLLIIPNRVDANSLTRCFRKVCHGVVGDSINDLILPVAREDLRPYLYELTEMERQELRKVKTVYYLPTVEVSKIIRQKAAFFDMKPSSPLPMFFIGDHVGFRYKLVKHIADGTYGLVMKAQDMAHLGPEPKYVAIKVNKRSLSHITTSEAKILKEISSPPTQKRLSLRQRHKIDSHVVTLLQVVKYRGWEAWVFPFYPTNWEMFTRYQRVVDLKRIRKLVQDMLMAFQFLHKQNIIHFDVKPENILYDPATDNSYLTDFGLSRHVSEVKRDEVSGSAPFMAPEAMLSIKGSFTSDIWSLGATLFTIISGQLLTEFEMAEDFYQSEKGLLRNLIVRIPPPETFLKSNMLPLYSGLENFSENSTVVDGSLISILRDGKRFYAEQDFLMYDAFTDFVSRCLQWEPEKRITIPEALKHPFLNNIS